MRGLLSKAHPSFERLLVVESGPRDVSETFLQHLYEVQKSERVDLLTCYPGCPKSFDGERGVIYSVHEGEAKEDRAQFIRKLLKNRYTVVAIFCTGDAVLTKWKWLIAVRTRAKLLIVNEHAGFFFFDVQHRGLVKTLLSLRLGMRQPLQFRLLAELFLVPFTIVYLALYALAIHAQRAIRLR